MSHKIERVGKKYQWLALYELGARLADNCAFLGGRKGNNEPSSYNGESFGSLRDLDPSLLVKKTYDDGWEKFVEAPWWAPIMPKCKVYSPIEQLQWLYGDSGFINSTQCIDVTDRADRRWLTLNSFCSVREKIRNKSGAECDTWSRLNCLVVQKDDLQKLVDGISNQALIDSYSIPTISVYAGHSYLGEYPWHSGFDDISDWIQPDETEGHIPVAVRPTVAEYRCERGSYDCSIDETVEVQLPAPWLIRALDMHLSDGHRVTYVDSDDVTRFFDPALDEEGAHAGIVDREVFLRLLDSMDLAAVWIIAGEKNAYGGDISNNGFGGRSVFTSLYWIDCGEWVHLDYNDFSAPSRKQVEVLLGGNVPSWVRTN